MPKNELKTFFLPFLVITLLISVTGGYLGAEIRKQVSRPVGSEALIALSEEATLKVEEESMTIDVVEKVSPAVVSIIIKKDVQDFSGRSGNNIFPFDDSFDPFFFPFSYPYDGRNERIPFEENAPKEKQKVGGGTGFIISPDGLILTNRHVVEDEQAEYTVSLKDGREFEAKVLGKDAINDVAVVKIESDEEFPYVVLGDSETLKPGQTVIAIGYALGEFNNSVTRGIVSGINRRINAGNGFGQSEVIEEAIQTDAAINPGNSGGPLLNLAGQVIAVNTAVSREGQSIGFAIPINVAKKAIESVKRFGKIVRPYLGVRYVLMTPEIQKENKFPFDYGALVVRGETPSQLAVVSGSPADKAGILENDVILEVNGEKVTLEKPLVKILGKYNPKDTIDVKLLSKGSEKNVKVTLEEFQE